MYHVFVRNWWKRNAGGYLEPDPRARKTTINKCCTEEEARNCAQEYNRTHKPGVLSRKAEYERV